MAGTCTDVVRLWELLRPLEASLLDLLELGIFDEVTEVELEVVEVLWLCTGVVELWKIVELLGLLMLDLLVLGVLVEKRRVELEVVGVFVELTIVTMEIVVGIVVETTPELYDVVWLGADLIIDLVAVVFRRVDEGWPVGVW